MTAAITTACGNLTLIRQVAVGTPPISNIILQRAGVSCYYDLAVNAPPAGTTIEFSEDNVNWSTGTNIGGYYKADLLLLAPGYQREYARTRNLCGIGPVSSRNVPIPPPPANCQYRPITKNNSKSDEKLLNISTVRVYPNPVNKKLLIEVPSINNTWVNIYNNEGKLMHNARLSNTKSSLNISSYRSGLLSYQGHGKRAGKNNEDH